MPPKEKALELIFIFGSMKLALGAVDQIKKAFINYGNDSGELQNMDNDFRYWEKVKTEINRIFYDL